MEIPRKISQNPVRAFPKAPLEYAVMPQQLVDAYLGRENRQENFDRVSQQRLATFVHLLRKLKSAQRNVQITREYNESLKDQLQKLKKEYAAKLEADRKEQERARKELEESAALKKKMEESARQKAASLVHEETNVQKDRPDEAKEPPTVQPSSSKEEQPAAAKATGFGGFAFGQKTAPPAAPAAQAPPTVAATSDAQPNNDNPFAAIKPSQQFQFKPTNIGFNEQPSISMASIQQKFGNSGAGSQFDNLF